MNYRETVKKITASYEEKKPSRVDELKKLDRKIKRPSTAFAYTFGIISALVLGFGMCLAMKVLFDLMAVGIVIGIVGIVMCLITYPIYNKMLTSAKRKNASKINALAEDILKA